MLRGDHIIIGSVSISPVFVRSDVPEILYVPANSWGKFDLPILKMSSSSDIYSTEGFPRAYFYFSLQASQPLCILNYNS